MTKIGCEIMNWINSKCNTGYIIGVSAIIPRVQYGFMHYACQYTIVVGAPQIGSEIIKCKLKVDYGPQIDCPWN